MTETSFTPRQILNADFSLAHLRLLRTIAFSPSSGTRVRLVQVKETREYYSLKLIRKQHVCKLNRFDQINATLLVLLKLRSDEAIGIHLISQLI